MPVGPRGPRADGTLIAFGAGRAYVALRTDIPAITLWPGRTVIALLALDTLSAGVAHGTLRPHVTFVALGTGQAARTIRAGIADLSFGSLRSGSASVTFIAGLALAAGRAFGSLRTNIPGVALRSGLATVAGVTLGTLRTDRTDVTTITLGTLIALRPGRAGIAANALVAPRPGRASEPSRTHGTLSAGVALHTLNALRALRPGERADGAIGDAVRH